jgi:hypothetical protein
MIRPLPLGRDALRGVRDQPVLGAGEIAGHADVTLVWLDARDRPGMPDDHLYHSH